MAVTVRVQGDEETIREIQKIERKIKVRALKKSMNAGANPYLKTARRRAPKQNRYLARSLAKKVKQYNTSEANVGAMAVVGQTSGVKNKAAIVAKVSGRKNHQRRGGGISGRGLLVPVHLVDQPVKPHRITPRQNRIVYGKRAALVWEYGKRRRSKRYARGAVRHPGHPGKQFLEVAALQARPEVESKVYGVLKAETEKAASESAGAKQ